MEKWDGCYLPFKNKKIIKNKGNRIVTITPVDMIGLLDLLVAQF
jgi:hypothetical protein